jgi:protein-S-isoprenylcysteine O-methyltransferase Ste14
MDLSVGTFNTLLTIWIFIALGIFFVLHWRRAAYGRYAGDSRLWQMPDALGWVLMESISPILMAILFFTGNRMGNLPSQIFAGVWFLHYAHRSWVFPLIAKKRGRHIPVDIVIFGILFNGINAGTNGVWLFHLGPERAAQWLSDPRFVVGALLFLIGVAINLTSDYHLVSLRKNGGAEYVIPRRGVFRWVSCPNYLGEIVEWCGWAIATWSLAGVAFAIWTACNLVPRALTHHRWYREKFADYPPQRKALIPFVL